MFRWTSEFEIGKESSFVAVWVKFYNLPLHYYNESSLRMLGSLIGTILRIDTHTLDLRHQVYSRVCIEIDVTQKLEEQLWIGISKENGWLINVEYEGNHAYCSYCALLGHTIRLCRKKRNDNGKSLVGATNKEPQTAASTKHGPKDRNQWMVKARAQPQQHMEQNTPHEILKKPEDGDTDAIRQALNEAGLLSEDGHDNKHEDTPRSSDTNHREINQEGDTNSVGFKKHHMDEDTTGLQAQGLKNSEIHTQGTTSAELLDKEIENTIEGGTRPGFPSMMAGTEKVQESRVITTPTKNRFDVLDTEGELHNAYQNLQKPEASHSLALVPIPEDYEKSFLDGSGTKSQSNMGLPGNRSATNSDEDNTKKSTRKRSTLASKEQRKRSSSEPNKGEAKSL